MLSYVVSFTIILIAPFIELTKSHFLTFFNFKPLQDIQTAPELKFKIIILQIYLKIS
jgi:hypothetical protein